MAPPLFASSAAGRNGVFGDGSLGGDISPSSIRTSSDPTTTTGAGGSGAGGGVPFRAAAVAAEAASAWLTSGSEFERFLKPCRGGPSEVGDASCDEVLAHVLEEVRTIGRGLVESGAGVLGDGEDQCAGA